MNCYRSLIQTQIWNNPENVIYQDEQIESFILYFTASYHKRRTRYKIEKISTENSDSGLSPILYGHGQFSLTSSLKESINQGSHSEYNVNFQACCWKSSSYNLSNPDIDLRKVFRKKVPEFNLDIKKILISFMYLLNDQFLSKTDSAVICEK